MPTFAGKSEKFELSENLFPTNLKIHNQLTEENKINYFHSLMRGDALQTFKNITSPNREKLGEILTVFRRKYVKLQSMATTKHKLQRLVFNKPAHQKLFEFRDELHKLANWRKMYSELLLKRSSNNSFMPKIPLHLKKSFEQTHLENGTYEQNVSHLDRELELNALEAPDELQISTVTQQATQQNSEKPKPNCHNCKKPGHYRNQWRQLKRQKDQARNNTSSADKNNKKFGNGPTNSNCNNKFSSNTNANKTNFQKDRNPRPAYPPSETCGKTNHSTEKC